MNNVLEYICNHPKEIKIIISITDKQLIKSIENTQKIEEKKTDDCQLRKKINQSRGRNKKVFKQVFIGNFAVILFASCTNISNTRSNIWTGLTEQQYL